MASAGSGQWRPPTKSARAPSGQRTAGNNSGRGDKSTWLKLQIADWRFQIELTPDDFRRLHAKSETYNLKSAIFHASSPRNLVRLGPGLGLSRRNPSYGHGKLDLSGPERARHSAGGVPCGRRKDERLRRHCSGNIWLMVGCGGELLGRTLAGSSRDRALGPLFFH